MGFVLENLCKCFEEKFGYQQSLCSLLNRVIAAHRNELLFYGMY